jgi:hypothetical protein
VSLVPGPHEPRDAVSDVPAPHGRLLAVSDVPGGPGRAITPGRCGVAVDVAGGDVGVDVDGCVGRVGSLTMTTG